MNMDTVIQPIYLLSALLFIGPLAPKGLKIDITGSLVLVDGGLHRAMI